MWFFKVNVHVCIFYILFYFVLFYFICKRQKRYFQGWVTLKKRLLYFYLFFNFLKVASPS